MKEEVQFENEDDDLVIIKESDLISNSFSFPSEDENEEIEQEDDIEENKNFFSELFGRSTNSNEDTNTKFGSESVRKIVDTRRITNINKAYSNVKSREIDIRDNKGNIRDE